MTRLPTVVLVLVLVLVLAGAGCGSVEAPAVSAHDTPAFLRPSPGLVRAPPPALGPGPLALERALAVAEAENPLVQAAVADLAAARGREVQAGLWPNPTAFAGTSDGPIYREGGADEAKWFAGFAYALPVGGRIGAAEAAAGKDREATEAAVELVRRQVRFEVRDAFAAIEFFEEVLALTRQFDGFAASGRELVLAKIAKGEASPAEQHKVEQEQERLDIELIEAASDLEGARLRLAHALGRPAAPIDLIARPRAPTACAQAALLARGDAVVAAHPRVRALALRWEFTRFALLQARRERIPDVSLSADVATTRDLRDQDDVALELGLAVPIPIVDRNQGRIAEAEAAVRRAAREADVAAHALQLEVRDADRRHDLACERVRQYREEIVPDAEDALARARREYEAGKFNVVDLLDGYRTFAETREALLESMREHAVVRAEMDRLTGN